VAFPETGREARLDRLRSWTEDEETRFLTRAVYSKTAAVPDRWLTGEYRVFLHFGEGSPVAETPRRNGMRAWLDGPVRDAAVVRVNGTRAGSVWCPPYEIEVTRFLRAGENRLSIEVGNTAINYMSARSRPDYRLLNLRYGTRFEPQDMENLEPLPSGLLGPVRLVAK
jgi:hypothetical protein